MVFKKIVVYLQYNNKPKNKKVMETYFETKNGNCIYISTEKNVGAKTRIRVWNSAKNKTYRFYSNTHMYEIANNIADLEYAIAKLFKTDTINILTEQLTIILD